MPTIDKKILPGIMTVEAVARFLRKSPSWVYKNWKQLGGVKLRGSLLFPDKEDLYERLFGEKAGVPYFRFHGLRHSGASTLDQAKVPIGTIQRILGHEDRTTTEIYLHSIDESEREAMRIFEVFRQKSHTKSHTGHGMETVAGYIN